MLPLDSSQCPNLYPVFQQNCIKRCQIIPDFILSDLMLLNDEEIQHSPRRMSASFDPSEEVNKIQFFIGSSSLFEQRKNSQSLLREMPLRNLPKMSTPVMRALPNETEPPITSHPIVEPVNSNQPVQASALKFRVFDAEYRSIASEDNKPITISEESLLPDESFDDWPDYAKNVLDCAKKVYEFYSTVFSINSMDYWGTGIDSIVNVREWCQDPNDKKKYTLQVMSNAYWDGHRMAYGEGDNKVFYDFTRSKEIIGHELTHRFTQFAYKFDIDDYHDQSGALNEHLADVFGIMFAQRDNKEEKPSEANWLVGKDLIKDNFRRMLKVRKLGHYDALRSIKAPGTAYELTNKDKSRKDPQPDNMSDYNKTTVDYGGVHINSGILNRAFYLFTTKVNSPSWQIPGKLWFDTITSGTITSKSNFEDFAKATQEIAKKTLSGSEQTALAQAWTEVQIIK